MDGIGSRVKDQLGPEFFVAAFDALGIGIVVLDQSEQVIFFNSAMGRISGHDDGLSLSSLGLKLHGTSENAKLKSLVHRAQHGRRKKEVKFLIPRPSGKRPYNAVLKLLEQSSENGKPLTMICVKDPGHSSKAAAPLLRDTWGLSPAEAELALALLDTGSLQAAATRRGITEGSARQYVKRIFHKTLTKGQVDLVALLMGAVGF